MIKNAVGSLKGITYYEIVFNGSASIEPAEYAGITHIIEHCMCEQVKSLEQEFKEKSIHWNACTSSNQMKFHIFGMSKYIKQYREKFTDLILNYQITKDVFERERNIIVAEYYQTFSDQGEAFLSNWMRKHYNFADAIGTIEAIKSLTYENFINYKNKYYSIPSYIGYIHPKSDSDIQNLDIKFNNIPEFQECPKYGNYNTFKMESCAEFNSQRILMSCFRLNMTNDYEELAAAKYLTSILCGGLTSPLYQELREKLQCVYYIGPSINILDKQNFDVCIWVYVDATKADICMNKFKELILNCKKYLTKKEYKIVVNSKSNAIKFRNLSTFNTSNKFSEISDKIEKIFVKKSLSYEKFMDYINKFLNSPIEFYKDDDYR